jgi:acetyl-CoA carboxylase biotin carboxylase subunit
MFRKILVANRGEIALRIIQAAKKLGIQTVAVYSKADAASPHLKYADTTVCIGPAPSSQSYLAMEAILQTALQYDCQALHPGYGFLSQNALFAALCEQYKITFVGPSPNSMRNMGDKAHARSMMQEAGVDVVPGSTAIISSPEEALRLSHQLGFPVLLKATAGGGGRGMRLCRSEAELGQNFVQASLEAEKAFGNASLYLEKYIEGARHIELQVLGDAFGNIIHLGERECSVQRRHQKLVEEAPSPALNEQLRNHFGERAIKAIKKIGYQSAGTLEFIMDAESHLYFIEMNTRIQVEHPVSEMITGADIVEEQIRIAAQHELRKKQKDVTFQGHAIECRINAEDPANHFQPHPGQITRFRPPQVEVPGKIRIDTFVEEGCHIPPFYDSMICKLIAWGKNRPEAITTMQTALKNFVIEGVPTTIPFALQVIQSKQFTSGKYDTRIVEELIS